MKNDAPARFSTINLFPCCWVLIVLSAALSFSRTELAAATLGWTTNQVSTNAFGLDRVVFGNGRFVASGGFSDFGALMSSEDGLNWVLRAGGSNGVPPDLIYGLTYSEGRFMAVGHFGGIGVSLDGTTWAFSSVPIESLLGATYGGLFVAVGSRYYNPAGSNVFWSANGTTWNPSASTPSITLRGVAHGAGKYVAIGNNDGFVYRMASLNSWTQGTIPGGAEIFFYNNVFIVPFTAGTNLLSTDGLAWVPTPTGIPDFTQGLGVGGNGVCVARINNGMAVSRDGSNWVRFATGPLPGNAFGWNGKRIVTLRSEDVGPLLPPRLNAYVFTSDPFAGFLSLKRTQPAQLDLYGFAGGSYRLEFTESLSSDPGAWQTISNFVLPATPYTIAEPSATNASKRFYRAVLLP
jgi:hypothetical protein